MTAATRKPIEIGPVLGIPLLLVAALLSVPYVLGAIVYIAWRERQFFRHLRSQCRTLPWGEVEQHLRAGEGTLVIEQAQKQSHRLWWTPDDIPSLAPVPIPPFADVDFVFIAPDEPFAAWCFQRYLSSATGSAFLTRSVGLVFPPGFIEPDFFTTRFPSARVIATTLSLPKRE
jgi:hypothetical protein